MLIYYITFTRISYQTFKMRFQWTLYILVNTFIYNTHSHKNIVISEYV